MSEDERRVVCIVDDDASLRRSLRTLLASMGLRVETFQSADAFPEPGHGSADGGNERSRAPEASRRHGLAHPVIILTAHGNEDTRERTLQADAVAFLTRPFQGVAVVDAVRTALSTA